MALFFSSGPETQKARYTFIIEYFS